MPRYAWSWYDDPQLPFNCAYDSIEECLVDARLDAESESYDPARLVYIGEIEPYVPHVDVYKLLEAIEYDVGDEVGEAGYDYYAFNSVTDQPKILELQRLLDPIVHQWLKENDTYPDYSLVGNIVAYPLCDQPEEE